MVAVVLAAGSGSRLNGAVKPLLRIGGMSLLERAIRTLRSAGLERIIVVVGHERGRVREFALARKLGVEVVENDAFLIGNGTSVVAGGRVASGRFLVTMVDHIVDPEVVQRFLRAEGSFVAAVDSAPAFCDVDEATKICVRDSRVYEVGRELARFDAVDAGLFLCDPAVIGVAEQSLAAGGGSWNDIKRAYLAGGGEIRTFDLRGAFWLDVDTVSEARRAERLLLNRAAGKSQDGPVSRYLNRRLSRPAAQLLLRTGISPNGVTVLAFSLAILASVALALGQLWVIALIAGGLLVQAASVVDGVDGEVARVSLRSSPRGAYLDAVLDRTADAAVLGGLAAAAGFGTPTWILLAFALFATLQIPYIKASYESSCGMQFPHTAQALGFSRDMRLLVLALAAIALQPFLGLVVYTALAGMAVVRGFLVGWIGAPMPLPDRRGELELQRQADLDDRVVPVTGSPTRTLPGRFISRISIRMIPYSRTSVR